MWHKFVLCKSSRRSAQTVKKFKTAIFHSKYSWDFIQFRSIQKVFLSLAVRIFLCSTGSLQFLRYFDDIWHTDMSWRKDTRYWAFFGSERFLGAHFSYNTLFWNVFTQVIILSEVAHGHVNVFFVFS